MAVASKSASLESKSGLELSPGGLSNPPPLVSHLDLSIFEKGNL